MISASFLENMIKEYPEKKVVVFVRTNRLGQVGVVDALKRVDIDSECYAWRHRAKGSVFNPGSI